MYHPPGTTIVRILRAHWMTHGPAGGWRLQEVLRNLMISHVEFRSEEDADVAVYCHKREVALLLVEDSRETSIVVDRVMGALKEALLPLVRGGGLSQAAAAASCSLRIGCRRWRCPALLQWPSMRPTTC
jgi:ERCC4-related helicase